MRYRPEKQEILGLLETLGQINRNRQSKIGFYRKPELFHKDLLENADVVLLIKNQHRFFVFDGINGPKGNRTISLKLSINELIF